MNLGYNNDTDIIVKKKFFALKNEKKLDLWLEMWYTDFTCLGNYIKPD